MSFARVLFLVFSLEGRTVWGGGVWDGVGCFRCVVEMLKSRVPMTEKRSLAISYVMQHGPHALVRTIPVTRGNVRTKPARRGIDRGAHELSQLL